jgi:hypothetical protein
MRKIIEKYDLEISKSPSNYASRLLNTRYMKNASDEYLALVNEERKTNQDKLIALSVAKTGEFISKINDSYEYNDMEKLDANLKVHATLAKTKKDEASLGASAITVVFGDGTTVNDVTTNVKEFSNSPMKERATEADFVV